MTQESEKEYWGDDELIGEDLPGMMLLQRADLTSFYNQRGFRGTYPSLLYFYDEAERLSDQIVSGLSRAQAADSAVRFVISVHTKFTGETEAEEGSAVVRFEGSEALPEEVADDIRELMLSGIKNWLEEAYSTHGRQAILTWLSADANGAAGRIAGTRG